MSEKLEKLNQEIEKTEAKLRRAQHEEKILEHQIKTLTRKERTHRLCTRGAELERYLVLVKPFCNTLFDKYLPVTSLHWC